MLKKSLFVLGVLFGAQEVQSISTDKAIVYTAASVVTGGTILYWANREPNSEKINRANNLWYTVKQDLYEAQDGQDLLKFFSVYGYLSYKIEKSYQEINARYNNLIKPWNWTDEMKDSYEKISFLHAIFQANDIIIGAGEDGSQILKCMRSLYSNSRYSLLAAASDLRTHIKILKNSSYRVCTVNISQLVIDLLEFTLKEVTSSAEYKQEQRDKEVERLQQQQLHAQREAAYQAARSVAALEKLVKKDNKKEYYSADKKEYYSAGSEYYSADDDYDNYYSA